MAPTSVTVLCANAHRVNVKTNPSTSILQILEEACKKYEYNPDLYGLKHLKRALDVTTTMRFAGLPNRCVLEMVLLSTPRTQQPVNLCLIDEQGNKFIKKYLPTDSLWTVLQDSGVCSPESLLDASLEHTLVYSMHKVAGQSALSTTSLKQLGLSSGSGSMRYSCRKLETSGPSPPVVQPPAAAPPVNVAPVQPPDIQNVDPVVAPPPDIPAPMPEVIPVAMPEVIPVFNRPEVIPVDNNDGSVEVPPAMEVSDNEVASSDAIFSPDVVRSTSGIPDVVKRVDESAPLQPDVLSNEKCVSDADPAPSMPVAFSGAAYSLSRARAGDSAQPNEGAMALQPTASHLPSQLMEVDSTQDNASIALRTHRSVVFRAADVPAFGTQFDQETDDFFALTKEDVKRLHSEQRKKLMELENAPLLTQGLREAEEQSRVLAAINRFPVTQLRIHFPEEVVVQACFKPTDTVQDVAVYVSSLLQDEAKEFDLCTNFPRQPVPRHLTLVGASLVPKARLYFSSSSCQNSVLKQSVLASLVSYGEAQQALVTARPTSSNIGLPPGASPRGVAPQQSAGSSQPIASTSSSAASSSASKKPKWFKLGK